MNYYPPFCWLNHIPRHSCFFSLEMLCFALVIHSNHNRWCHPFVPHTFTDMLIQISTWRFIVVGYIPLHSTLGSLFILICIPFMLFRIFCIKTEFAKIIPGRRLLLGGLLGFTSRAWGALEMTPGLKRHQCEIEILGQNLGALPPNLSVEKRFYWSLVWTTVWTLISL